MDLGPPFNTLFHSRVGANYWGSGFEVSHIALLPSEESIKLKLSKNFAEIRQMQHRCPCLLFYPTFLRLVLPPPPPRHTAEPNLCFALHIYMGHGEKSTVSTVISSFAACNFRFGMKTGNNPTHTLHIGSYMWLNNG